MKNVLRNYWYMAAWGHEVKDEPLGRRFLDVPVVLFRDAGGNVAALRDRCPHRFAPLSKGRVIDGTVECRYHGLRFDGHGKCVHVPLPCNKQIPDIGVSAFPVREYDGFIWIWMGDPEKAESTPVPDTTYLRVHPDLEILRMYMHQESNFFLGIDNLMDPSHTAFLHRQTLSQGTDFFRDLFVRGSYACQSMEGGRINSQWSFVDAQGIHDQDEKFEAIWIAPSTILQRSRASVMGLRPNHESYSHFLHLLTPETEHTTHYFALDMYDRRETDAAYLKERETLLKETVFLAEDDPILAAIDRDMNGTDLFCLQPVILPADAAAIRVRRRYAKMLKEEGVAGEVERAEV